ncbi:MAG: serpin family protein, partial [Proteobacteria bacterium]|nr:serpin family protein [Pseudomonadota bacterium]
MIRLIPRQTGVKAVVLALALTFGATLAGAGPSDVPSLVRGQNALAIDLYQQLRRHESFQGKNIIFSPYSILTALAMAYAGAAGETKAQMARALRIALADGRFHAAGGALLKSLAAARRKGLKLHVANALWPQRDYAFLKSFIRLVTTHYGRRVFPQDFKARAEAARKRINAWVARVTMDRIKDLIPPGGVTALTRLVLTNAIYFKGDWLVKFDQKKTRDADFTLKSGRKVKVKMMRLTAPGGRPIAHVRYGDWGSFKVLELPYAGKRLSMIMFLPKKHDGLARLEGRLNPTDLSRWMKRLSEKKVVLVALPRFKITTPTIELTQVLRALGMRDAFIKSRADFSRMDGQRNLYISAVFHKAFIEVNETGTEAAAATAVVMRFTSAGPVQSRPPVFRADRPFLYL